MIMQVGLKVDLSALARVIAGTRDENTERDVGISGAVGGTEGGEGESRDAIWTDDQWRSLLEEHFTPVTTSSSAEAVTGATFAYTGPHDESLRLAHVGPVGPVMRGLLSLPPSIQGTPSVTSEVSVPLFVRFECSVTLEDGVGDGGRKSGDDDWDAPPPPIATSFLAHGDGIASVLRCS